MVKLISYAHEIRNLMEQQGVSASISLKTLQTFIDKPRFLRLGGRLKKSTLHYQKVHQMILPSNHHFIKLVVSAEHISLHQPGPQIVKASLREGYWIPRIRLLVKTATQQLMGELPST